MIEIHSVTLPELTGDEERRLYVYLPEAAVKEPRRRFPVLYMFDGHNVFFDEDATYGKSWGMGGYLDETGAPLIVAAVECNHHPDNGRMSEYAPFDFSHPRYGSFPGRGRQTMEWFVRNLKPRIDRDYPTLPDREHTFIAGSSMGGLMSLYALSAYNAVFSRAAALSPSLEFNGAALRELLKNADFAPDSVLYMDYGEREWGWGRRTTQHFGATVSLLLRKGVRVTARVVPDGEHREASWEKQLPFFIPTLLYGLEV